ncbi:MAG TPA: M28 family metallopeptidase [Pyrinomonadaceae bacterium]|jgi:N-acetylated-alpha-linked acidic dipeptidase|nr:M28 family metallopeptidase [Pyrinomonadaceae bacterium]
MKAFVRAALALFLTINFACATLIPCAYAQTKEAAPVLDGFTAGESDAQRQLEERFRAVPLPASAREHLRTLTREPHVAGTPEDYRTAVYVRDQLRRFGIDAELREYQVLLPYPKHPTRLELVAPRRVPLAVEEAVLPQDPSSSHQRIIPLFNGYSATGDVTAPLVYVNYGLPDDYAALKKIKVDVKGKLVIARYGRSFRGVKAKVAEENGAVGLIIYSDPADDGYMQGDVYPNGPWRPETSAQRGSVLYLFQYPGDPLTPGQPAIAGTTRLKEDDPTLNIPRIPVQPISYGDARRLLEPLRGAVRPDGFQGGLPFAYHVGGTEDVRVRLKTEMDFKIRTIWNVIGRIEGAEERDRWVVLGNHRDAWTFGAVDPNSGTTAMLELARGFGELLKQNWRPRRTIIFGSWDGEEHGLIGSTEWAEENAAALKANAVAYLNMDSAVSGANFGASSVPTLWKLIRMAARDVRDPKTGKSVYQAWQDRVRDARPEAELTDAGAGTDTPIAEARINALGSGSDYTPFLQHLGVTSLDMGFGGDYGVYHSAYDSFNWMEKFGDPDFVYHVAAAQIWGTITLRLANARALPFDYADYATEIRDFINETQKTAARRKLADDFDVKGLLDATKDLSDEAARVQSRQNALLEEIESRLRAGDTQPRALAPLKRINDSLIAAERALTDARGLRNRVWYKHQIYAPGLYTGYAAQPLPDLRQAIDDRNTTNAREAAVRINEAIRRAVAVLRDGRGN